jgi:uncharacterized protein YjbI with pentapeptide repeats
LSLHTTRYGVEDSSISTDFANANLEKANFANADLRSANLSGANLKEAILVETTLVGDNLSNADLSRSYLINAYLNGANLSETNLSGASFVRAYLNGAKLSRADMNKAIMGWTTIGDVDLRYIRGLDTLQHIGPSTIGIDTILRSEGEVPEIFLYGTGATDAFIDYVRSLTRTPINFYSCFVSYSSRDEALARRLRDDLRTQGVRCWFAPEDMKIGDKIRARIDEAISLQDKLLLLLSKHSIASTWVESEVEAALEKEDRQQREMLFPVRIDDAVIQTSQAWAATLRRTRHIGDFTRWTDPREYQKAFERLLHDLKAEQKPAI